MERTNRLYDCITEIGDDYLKQAEEFCPEQNGTKVIPWKRWATLAAAVLLVIGIGKVMPGGDASSSASAPAASEPAASAPAAEHAPSEPQHSLGGVGSGSFEYLTGDQEHSISAKEIVFTDGEIWTILASEETDDMDLPKNLADAAAGEPDLWLAYVDGAYVPSDKPTDTALYTYTESVSIVRQGDTYYAAVLKQAP